MITTDTIKTLNIPKYEDLSLHHVYNKVLDKFPEMEDYFPHYHKEYLPP